MVYAPFYCYKVTHKQENQLTYTYQLIEAKISVEATKLNKEKRDIIKRVVLVFLSLCFPVQLSHNTMILSRS